MNEATHAPRDFIVRTMNAEEVNLAIEWAAHEGWNPGFHDAHVFRAADPDGFFIGELQGEPVGSISAVAYDAHFGFIGLYIVRPEFRGKGLGLRIWQHGIAYLGKRNVGLDGVVAQQPNYRKSGFELAYRNIRFQGVAEADVTNHPSLVDAHQLPFDKLASYDQRFFPRRAKPFCACGSINRMPSRSQASAKATSAATACFAAAAKDARSDRYSPTTRKQPKPCSLRLSRIAPARPSRSTCPNSTRPPSRSPNGIA